MILASRSPPTECCKIHPVGRERGVNLTADGSGKSRSA
jgi:hypothetical protein